MSAMAPQLLFQQAVSLHQQGKLTEAEPLYLQVMAAAPENFPTRYMFALLRYEQKRNAEALEAVEKALMLNPAAPDALALQGALLQADGQREQALASFDAALAHKSDNASNWYNRGTLLESLGRRENALASFTKALTLNPGHAEAWHHSGTVLAALGRGEDALAAFDKCLALKPDHAKVWHIRGVLLQGAGRFEDALASYDRCVAADPHYAKAWSNCGAVLLDLKRFEEGLASLDRALADAPGSAVIWHNHGTALKELKRNEEALASFTKALTLAPDLAQAWNSRSAIHWTEKRYGQAVADLEQVIRIAPDYNYARGLLLHQKMHGGDWRDFDRELAAIHDGVRTGKHIVQPFVYQAISQSPEDLQKCSTIYASHLYPAAPALALKANRNHRKIRLGYVSGEMRGQAIGYLMVGVFEHHDRKKFELIILDNGFGDGSPTRKRIEAAADRMIDITRLSNQAAAERIRDEEIDILVNLNGYFGSVRMEIFAGRPAPIQVNYLGLPATLGAPYIDYIIADRTVIPDQERKFYTESVVHLPDTYWPTDNRQAVAPETPSRAECGLPERGFVFCNFNQSYKLMPFMFDSWMRILAQVEGSVLWLSECYDAFPGNMRAEAERRFIAPERLIFAPALSNDRHLARLKAADLSLDSIPYNAHTTACDVLCVGVPLVTCPGTTFPGRVAASLLGAMEMPELIAANLDAYESLAVALARDPARLKNIREKLAKNKPATPLFDTARFTRRLEAAYTEMWGRWLRGETPSALKMTDPR